MTPSYNNTGGPEEKQLQQSQKTQTSTKQNMIILDIETTGLDPRRNCMLSLGAVDFATGKEFYGECSVYPESLFDDVAMEINGFKREDVLPGRKQRADDLYWEFVKWTIQFEGPKILGGHNIGSFDFLFLRELHNRAWFPKWSFGFRTVDLHSVAFSVLHESLSHSDICRRLGLQPEPKPHNALEGARSERNAFMELFRIQAEHKAMWEYIESFKASCPANMTIEAKANFIIENGKVTPGHEILFTRLTN